MGPSTALIKCVRGRLSFNLVHEMSILFCMPPKNTGHSFSPLSSRVAVLISFSKNGRYSSLFLSLLSISLSQEMVDLLRVRPSPNLVRERESDRIPSHELLDPVKEKDKEKPATSELAADPSKAVRNLSL